MAARVLSTESAVASLFETVGPRTTLAVASSGGHLRFGAGGTQVGVRPPDCPVAFDFLRPPSGITELSAIWQSSIIQGLKHPKCQQICASHAQWHIWTSTGNTIGRYPQE